jgi:hypothetical protein
MGAASSLGSMTDLDDLARRVYDHFEGVHREIFRGDPAANPKLKVEVLDPEMVGDTPTLVLVTPWTLNGMAFPPDARFPDSLAVNTKVLPVFRNELDGIGAYVSVNLVADVSTLQSPDAARGVGRSLGAGFRTAVEEARQIGDRGRRDLLRGRPPSE